MFIVIEGIDGTGKSTQAQQLAAWLRGQGREVIVDYEPTFGVHGKKLRDSFVNGRLTPEEELELFLADRREHVEQVIAPALAAGKTVILDRYYFSNMAYQGAIGFDPAEIRRRNEAFAPVPDLLFILDLDVDTALSRIGGRGDTANEFEKRENLERCREIFLSLQDEPFARVIDTRGTMEEVQAEIRASVGSDRLTDCEL
jgi:dTMP kinase